jgi:hypothetical protein
MDFVDIFPRSLSRRSARIDGDAFPNRPSRYHLLLAQVPRTLPRPILYSSPLSPESSFHLQDALADTYLQAPLHETLQRIQLVIQLLVFHVVLPLQTRKQSRSDTTRGQTLTPRSQTSSNTTSSRIVSGIAQTGSSKRQFLPSKKRKKLNQRSDGDDSDGEEQPQGELPKSKQKEEGLLFACPYVKHDRARYGQITCCNGHGWPNVARIK